MIPEIGHFALALVLVLSLVQIYVTFYCYRNACENRHPENKQLDPCFHRDFEKLSIVITRLIFGLSLVSFLCLVMAYVVSDFSVLNVVKNSHTDKPLLYKITGAWGNHEGSMLLWVVLLALMGGIYTWHNRNACGNRHPEKKQLDPCFRRDFESFTLAIHGALVALFSAFTLITSNPFERIFPPTLNGLSLNPLLQHPALAIHPPLLYLGYVGFGMVFALTIGALLSKTQPQEWAKTVRPWALFAWTSLGAGTALGAWWAYAELGWGGWWFWDPVENAALMPWLTGTALVHCLIALQKRGVMARWTCLLAILTFVLCVMGLFLVRSGLLTSVHSFASSPERGLFILGILSLIAGGGFAVFAYASITDKAQSTFSLFSRESSLLAASAFLFSAFVTVFIGTLYPLALESLNQPPVSIGPPYFHRTFVPLLLPVIWLIPLAPFLAWQEGSTKAALSRVSFAGVAALAGGLIGLFFIKDTPFLSFIGIATGLWVMIGGAMPLVRNIMIQKSLRVPLGPWGVALGHGGAGLAILAMAASALWQSEHIQALSLNEPFVFTEKTGQMQAVSTQPKDNFKETKALINLGDFTLTPSRRFYPASDTETSEAAIHSTITADWFATLGQKLDNKRWAVHLRHIPMMLWLWIGFILVTIGGIISTIKVIRQNRKEP